MESIYDFSKSILLLMQIPHIMKQLFTILLFSLVTSCNNNVIKSNNETIVSIVPLTTSITASCRGIAMDQHQVWVAGNNGSVIKSTNHGSTWQKISLPDSDSLDFRDIAILSKDNILLMSAGSGPLTRIYKTIDGGDSWEITLKNNKEKAFFNGFDFKDDHNGVLVSDPIDSILYLLKTEDGGTNWQQIGKQTLPPLLSTEYGFAASGTGIVYKENQIWIATGGDQSRIFKSNDNGNHWTVYPTPMAHGNNSSGTFSISFRNALNGIAVGGDYLDPDVDKGNLSRTSDGGKNWTLVKNNPPVLHKACVQFLGGTSYLTAGRTGIMVSHDDGLSWEQLSDVGYYTITYDETSKVGFLAGSEGRVARFQVSVKKN